MYVVGKRDVLDSILSLKHQGDFGEGCAVGEFNVVSSLEERQGNSVKLNSIDWI